MRRATEQDVARFFDDRVACCVSKTPRRRPIWERTTRAFQDAVISGGVAGRSVLDLGCGGGGVTLAMLRAGAARVTGVDLSAAALAAAERTVGEAGMAGRATFVNGNAATVQLEPHDVVLHSRVLCCYADVRPFLANTLPTARLLYAFSMPRTDGVWALLSRLVLAHENLWHRIKGRGFRAYVHDVRAVHAAVEAAGFSVRARRTSGAWTIAVFVRGA